MRRMGQTPTPRSFSALQRAEIAEILEPLAPWLVDSPGFSALQRAEIAEIAPPLVLRSVYVRFSALQRAEIAEIPALSVVRAGSRLGFSALQRAEIAEIVKRRHTAPRVWLVSVLFNEPKLLKSILCSLYLLYHRSFSALQRAEIAEMSP